ncbi:hypothetical protein NM208_g2632 [Fusarium decemcellulare]|uniref:Uncharacterized protein n=1 Tax=Fusarium decemcellulare TaxID=57161 RepID=A0ACC1SRQ6_9HYPO|nr:hypothetical protein NM208_g2632 [Fusarium decemcellulare]
MITRMTASNRSDALSGVPTGAPRVMDLSAIERGPTIAPRQAVNIPYRQRPQSSGHKSRNSEPRTTMNLGKNLGLNLGLKANLNLTMNTTVDGLRRDPTTNAVVKYLQPSPIMNTAATVLRLGRAIKRQTNTNQH